MTKLSGPVVAHPQAQSNVLSVRAKAYVFADPKSRALLAQIERVAASDAAVLIIGETGTGKELVARHLHQRSGRKGQFVAVNCGALSQNLAEAELFGHQAGSFTGATETRMGWFEAANGGTLFLDEIGDLPPALQVKLLRVLQEGEVVRVGSRKAIPLDVRLIAATNLDLAQAVVAGHFRADLYYRLNVVVLEVPTLAERGEDILPLVEYFIRLYSSRLRAPEPRLSPEAEAMLLKYRWPGNIRELENVMHSAVLMASDDCIRPENLRLATGAMANVPALPAGSPLDAITQQLDLLLADPPANLWHKLEELIVRRTFEHVAGNQMRAARVLGISRNMLRTLFKRFGLIG